jgi:hypothetical protein
MVAGAAGDKEDMPWVVVDDRLRGSVELLVALSEDPSPDLGLLSDLCSHQLAWRRHASPLSMPEDQRLV